MFLLLARYHYWLDNITLQELWKPMIQILEADAMNIHDNMLDISHPQQVDPAMAVESNALISRNQLVSGSNWQEPEGS